MLLGIRIRNYSIFSDNKAGILPEDIEHDGMDPSTIMSAGLLPAFSFANLTAFIGRNATGKSSFFDALSFLCDSTTMGCPQASIQKGRSGYKKLLHELDRLMSFECLFLLADTNGNHSSDGIYVHYNVIFDCDAHGRPFYARERMERIRKTASGEHEHQVILDLRDGVGTVYTGGQSIPGGVTDKRVSALRSYGALVSCPELSALYREISHWFFCCFSCDTAKKSNGNTVAPGGHKHLNTTGSNLENVLQYYLAEDKDRYNEMIRHIGDKIPAIRKTASSLPASFRKSPDKLFLYLLLLMDPMPRPLICVETPDMGLYHDMVDVLASEFRDYSMRYPFSQIMFTTHNPYILESLAPQEVWVFKRHDEEENKVGIECAGAVPIVSEMYRQGVGMGAIWYAGHFDE